MVVAVVSTVLASISTADKSCWSSYGTSCCIEIAFAPAIPDPPVASLSAKYKEASNHIVMIPSIIPGKPPWIIYVHMLVLKTELTMIIIAVTPFDRTFSYMEKHFL